MLNTVQSCSTHTGEINSRRVFETVVAKYEAIKPKLVYRCRCSGLNELCNYPDHRGGDWLQSSNWPRCIDVV